MVDAHVHIDQYGEADLAEALRQIDSRRILTIAVSMGIESYLRTVEIARSSASIVPSFGIHPWEAHKYRDRLEEIDEHLRATPLIGEAGLDFHWVEEKDRYPHQEIVFEYQCAWAGRLGKIMNLHTKGAEERVVQALRRHRVERSIVHWYSGPMDLIEDYLAAGSYFTVGVEVLSSERIQEIAMRVPKDRLLLETDNPGGFEWLFGEKGMPEVIFRVLEKVSRMKEMDQEALEGEAAQNWTRLTGEAMWQRSADEESAAGR